MQLKRTLLWLTCAAMLMPAALSWAADKDCGDGIFSTICSKYKSLETLEISAPDRFLYGIIDASVSGRFPQVLCKVRSLYGGQTLTGELRAIATFHKRTDYQPDLSTDPPTASSREVAFTVAASDPITGVTLSASEATEFVFYFPSPGIEPGITDLRFAVFFKGFSQGGGNTPVTAYGTKDLNEPQHILLVNSTDRVFIDGALYTAAEVRADSKLIGQIPDENLDPYTDLEIGVRIYQESISDKLLHAKTFDLTPARFTRVIVIADADEFSGNFQEHSSSRAPVPPIDPDAPDLIDNPGSLPINGVVNQGDGDAFENTQLQSFRGQKAHFIYWVCWHVGNSEEVTNAQWPSALNTEPVNTRYWLFDPESPPIGF